MSRWPDLTRRLEGALVVVEPLRTEHERGLFEAGLDREMWTYLSAFPNAFESDGRFHRWMEEALAASEAGTRGYGPTVRAGGWGADPDGYRGSGERVAVVPQIESAHAVATAADIAAVPGMGALFVGPADLAVATGLAPGSDGFAALLDDVERAAREHGVPLGTAVGTAAGARDLVHRYDFVLVGNEASLLGGAGRGVVEDLHPPLATADART